MGDMSQNKNFIDPFTLKKNCINDDKQGLVSQARVSVIEFLIIIQGIQLQIPSFLELQTFSLSDKMQWENAYDYYLLR